MQRIKVLGMYCEHLLVNLLCLCQLPSVVQRKTLLKPGLRSRGIRISCRALWLGSIPEMWFHLNDSTVNTHALPTSVKTKTTS
jgi:hypothetical protein